MSKTWIQLLDLFTLHQKQIQRILLVTCGVAVLCAVGGLIWHFASSAAPPDPMKAELSKVSNYIRSDEFLHASSRERGQYVDQLMNRYKNMTPAERDEARDNFGSIFQKDQQVRKTFWLSFVQNQADQYNKLSPEQKQKRIDTILAMRESMHGQHKTRQEFRDKNPMSRREMSPQRTQQGVDRFRGNLPFVLKQTTASDRAKMVGMARDMMSRMREKYGD